MKTMGVLGGMGPQASIRFYELAIKASQARGASKNSEFPHMLISNLPVPDFISDRVCEERSIAMVEQEAVRLEKAGADFLVISCNTMHLHLERFSRKVDIPFVSMVDAVVDRINVDQRGYVGVLGSPTTIRSKLYHRPLVDAGIQEVIAPSMPEQDRLGELIKCVIAGTISWHSEELLLSIARGVVKRGATAIVLGCTELPLVASKAKEELRDTKWYDSLEILANTAIEQVYS